MHYFLKGKHVICYIFIVHLFWVRTVLGQVPDELMIHSSAASWKYHEVSSFFLFLIAH